MVANPQARAQMMQLDPGRQAQVVGQMIQADPQLGSMLQQASANIDGMFGGMVYQRAAQPPYNLSRPEVDAMVRAYRANTQRG